MAETLFSKVCKDCSLRSKVDVDRADCSTSMGSSGVVSTLNDGMRRHEVVLEQGEVNDSETAGAVLSEAEALIDNCQGPETGLLLRKCGAGLATAFRWTHAVEVSAPNVYGPEDIVPKIQIAKPEDALEGNTNYIGSPEGFAGMHLPDWSSFMNYGIFRLTDRISGGHAELPKNGLILLDSAIGGEFSDAYRIRIANDGPSYTFRIGQPSSDEDKLNARQLLAEGVYKYVNADADALAASDQLQDKIDNRDWQRHQELLETMRDPAFWQRLNDANRSPDSD